MLGWLPHSERRLPTGMMTLMTVIIMVTLFSKFMINIFQEHPASVAFVNVLQPACVYFAQGPQTARNGPGCVH